MNNLPSLKMLSFKERWKTSVGEPELEKVPVKEIYKNISPKPRAGVAHFERVPEPVKTPQTALRSREPGFFFEGAAGKIDL